MPERKLAPQGVNLTALLRAYDRAQVKMTDEEKRAMNRRIVAGEETFSIPKKEAEGRRAAIRMAILQDKPVEEAEKDRQRLEKAAITPNAPGIEKLLHILGRDETKSKTYQAF